MLVFLMGIVSQFTTVQIFAEIVDKEISELQIMGNKSKIVQNEELIVDLSGNNTKSKSVQLLKDASFHEKSNILLTSSDKPTSKQSSLKSKIHVRSLKEETKAPDGYELDSKPIPFTSQKGQVEASQVAMTNKKVEKSKQKKETDNAQKNKPSAETMFKSENTNETKLINLAVKVARTKLPKTNEKKDAHMDRIGVVVLVSVILLKSRIARKKG